MGFIARYRERHQKLAHARKRAAELLPLCEKATGVTLGRPLTIEESKPWKHKLRYFRHAVSTLLGLKPERQDGFALSRITSFELQMALRKLVCPGNYEEKMFGYFYPSAGVVGVNLNHYSPGAAASDYVLAHELVHLLLSKHKAFDKVASAEPGLMLTEGAATFYGNMVARGIHPAFDITSHRSYKEEYRRGNEFFSAVSSTLGDPASVIGAYAPRLVLLEDNPVLATAEATASYIEMVRQARAHGQTSIEFFGNEYQPFRDLLYSYKPAIAYTMPMERA